MHCWFQSFRGICYLTMGCQYLLVAACNFILMVQCISYRRWDWKCPPAQRWRPAPTKIYSILKSNLPRSIGLPHVIWNLFINLLCSVFSVLCVCLFVRFFPMYKKHDWNISLNQDDIILFLHYFTLFYSSAFCLYLPLSSSNRRTRNLLVHFWRRRLSLAFIGASKCIYEQIWTLGWAFMQ